jgi:prevent-host-death family protein
MTDMPKLSVTSAEFQKAFGRYREVAQREPVTITNHGRDSLVLLSADEYHRLKRRDRVALRVEDLSEEDVHAILTAEIPPEASQYDHEMSS